LVLENIGTERRECVCDWWESQKTEWWMWSRYCS
jgi:hypothetical protein